MKDLPRQKSWHLKAVHEFTSLAFQLSTALLERLGRFETSLKHAGIYIMGKGWGRTTVFNR